MVFRQAKFCAMITVLLYFHPPQAQSFRSDTKLKKVAYTIFVNELSAHCDHTVDIDRKPNKLCNLTRQNYFFFSILILFAHFNFKDSCLDCQPSSIKLNTISKSYYYLSVNEFGIYHVLNPIYLFLPYSSLVLCCVTFDLI